MIFSGSFLGQPPVEMHDFYRKTACENASSQTVGSSDTALFISQARDNYNRLWHKKEVSALYSFLLVLRG